MEVHSVQFMAALSANGSCHFGVDAVIDKHYCCSLSARQVVTDHLIIAADVDAAYMDLGRWTAEVRHAGHHAPSARTLNVAIPLNSCGRR